MFLILELSSELILCIASFLEQVDLLNVSLTCKRLNEVTEPELYREYSNPRLHSRAVAQFVRRVIRKPEIARYVKRIDIKGWETLDGLQPGNYEASEALSGILTTREKKIEDFERWLAQEPTENEYNRLIEAAKATGIIEEVFPYEAESTVISKSKPMLSADVPDGSIWFTHVFDNNIASDDIPQDRKFCQLLRAGIDDAYVVLLLSLLPNVREVFLRGVGSDQTALGLPRPYHRYEALRTLKIGCMDRQEAWGIDYIEILLAQAPLEALHLHNASSWCQQDIDNPHRPISLKLRSGSLHLTTLEMDNCTLRKSDMQTLLNATTSLRSLLYWTGNEETGPENFTSRELVAMLEPFKDTLEELYLEIVHYWTDFEEVGRITALSQFSALKILDTTPEMWTHLMDEENGRRPIEAEHRFCHRLPPNLEKLILHPPRDLESFDDGSIPDIPDIRQIEDVILNQSQLLLHLQEIYIGSAYAEHGYFLNQALEKHQPNLNGLKVTVGIGRARCAPTRSVFDNVWPTFRLPEIKWDINKYAIISADRTRGFQLRFPGCTVEDVEAEEANDPELQELEWIKAQDEYLAGRYALAEEGMEDDPASIQYYTEMLYGEQENLSSDPDLDLHPNREEDNE
ncbi:hypothetical protein EKO04_007551 [Ascochyta lentis]|uniref:F-box domain-containing protein n=1 Tax=Ascochyta lentis TaxID=205686 RepID=A0A8H7MH95_9PLEO|nr:hypothetical protein EKO04_007551 [Ascochyta lentis]